MLLYLCIFSKLTLSNVLPIFSAWATYAVGLSKISWKCYWSNIKQMDPPPLIHPPLYTLLIKPCNDSSRNATHTGTDFDKRYQLKFQINIQIIVEFTLLLFFRYKDFTTLYSIIILSALICSVLVCYMLLKQMHACDFH